MTGRRTTSKLCGRFLAVTAAALLAIGCTTGPVTAPPATSTATGQPTELASSGLVPSEATPTEAPPTEVPPTEASPTEAPSAEATLAPGATPTPNVTSLKVPSRPDCNADNGTGTMGYIHISWTAEGTAGVRVSIDPPSAAEAYGYGYADYPEPVGGADVPFACSPPNHDANGDYHLYVVTTLQDKGYYAWRYAKVYQKAP
ncbi:MAG: hypothetical protein HY263_00760 [Chloroflexi bacterium]|nr:hypothetical protein [Chloroflexota bacterium]